MGEIDSIDCSGKWLDLRTPQIMGILNLTTDSFSDGGQFITRDGSVDTDQVLRAAEQMVVDGATIIDLGGESTRPGAVPVAEQQEIERVAPLVELLASRIDAIISVDTSSPKLMSESAGLGAGMINDVRGLARPEALAVVAESGLPVCIMHMQGQPNTMQDQPVYNSIVSEVIGYFQARIVESIEAGIDKRKILIDPGFGFGKTLKHNLELLTGLAEFKTLGLPILVGISRKAMIGQMTGRPLDERVSGSVAAAMLTIQNGANIVRVHDVAATRDMIKIHLAVTGEIS
ncbi:MAG: dihydropteroate synthase [Pseudomonadales bacterium]|nr:dihydropteroate synthase [Pseudomonadales bacterium]